jgi:uncharacterized protein (DUF3820 family)
VTCRPIMVDGQRAGFVCGRGGTRPCAYCRGPSTKLCDGDVGEGRTCDRPMCDAHAYQDGPNRDLCRQHQPVSLSDPGAMKMPFGKHKGEAIENIPSEYLRWCLENLSGDRHRALLVEMEGQLQMRLGRGVSRGAK